VRPDGFAFGETAFQIFILNASRRLMTDRFYTKDYRPEVYTPEGYGLGGKHHDGRRAEVATTRQLALSLTGVDNAFKPWGLNMPADYENLAGQRQGRPLVGQWRQVAPSTRPPCPA
jgi:hypothetical protein